MVEIATEVQKACNQIMGAIDTFRTTGISTVTEEELRSRTTYLNCSILTETPTRSALFQATRLLRAEGILERRVLRRADPNFPEVTETTVLYDIAPKPENSSGPS